jgi:hypothetical protein
MEELIHAIEIRIRALVKKYHEQQQNQLLFAEEKDALLMKQKSVVTQIEELVTHLKSIEGLL